MLFVLLGARINNWEPNDDNNTLGHPAKLHYSCILKKSRGAHRRQHTKASTAAGSKPTAHHYVLVLSALAEQQCPLLLTAEIRTQQSPPPPKKNKNKVGGSVGEFRAGEREEREEPLDAEEKSRHNTFRPSQLFEGGSIANHHPFVVLHPTSTGGAGVGGRGGWLIQMLKKKTQGFSKGREFLYVGRINKWPKNKNKKGERSASGGNRKARQTHRSSNFCFCLEALYFAFILTVCKKKKNWSLKLIM